MQCQGKPHMTKKIVLIVDEGGSNMKRITDDYYAYYNEDFICPECGSDKHPIIEESYEYSDADGNRGIWVRWLECMDCDYETGFNL